MSGELVPAHDLLRWVEIENAKRYPDVFAPDEPVVATGAGRGHGEDPRRRVSVVAESGEGFVSSKDQGAQNLWRSPSPTTTCTGRR